MRYTVPRLVGIALLLVITKTAIVAVAGGSYAALCNWDCAWYRSILEGYHSVIPPVGQQELSNVAFFPGYPILARVLGAILRLGPDVALLLTAQLAGWAMWVYVLLFLRAWDAPAAIAWGTLAAIYVHPAAFYLSAGYSESVFLASVLGLILFSARRPLLASVHGFIMTATRVVGLPVVAVPFVGGVGPRAILVAALSALGMISFLVYCQIRFGMWNLYFETQRIGWYNRADLYAFMDWRIYFPLSPFLSWREWMETTSFNPHAIGTLSTQLTIYQFLGMLGLEGWARSRGIPGFRERASFYLAGALLFFCAVIGVKYTQFAGMIRYSYCSFVLLVMALAHFLVQARKARGKTPPAILCWALAAIGAASFALQYCFIQMYLHGRFVS